MRLRAITTDTYEVRPVYRPTGAPFLLWLLLGLASWGLLLGLVFGGIAVGRLL